MRRTTQETTRKGGVRGTRLGEERSRHSSVRDPTLRVFCVQSRDMVYRMSLDMLSVKRQDVVYNGCQYIRYTFRFCLPSAWSAEPA